MKVKFFTWLAVKGRIWTADRSHRRGLTTDTDCRLCDHEVEIADHLLYTCSFTKQVWHSLFTCLVTNAKPSAYCRFKLPGVVAYFALRPVQIIEEGTRYSRDTRLLDGVERGV